MLALLLRNYSHSLRSMQFVEMKAYGMKISPQIFTRVTSAMLHLDALNATYFEKTFLQFT